MIVSSAAALVAACTAVFGLHSSSSTVSSYSYLAFGSALRSLTARSAELRPPMPLAATPPVSGPMKATFTLSLALAGTAAAAASKAAARIAAVRSALVMKTPLVDRRGPMFAHATPVGKALRAGAAGASTGSAHRLPQCRADPFVISFHQLDIGRRVNRDGRLQDVVEDFDGELPLLVRQRRVGPGLHDRPRDLARWVDEPFGAGVDPDHDIQDAGGDLAVFGVIPEAVLSRDLLEPGAHFRVAAVWACPVPPAGERVDRVARGDVTQDLALGQPDLPSGRRLCRRPAMREHRGHHEAGRDGAKRREPKPRRHGAAVTASGRRSGRNICGRRRRCRDFARSLPSSMTR